MNEGKQLFTYLIAPESIYLLKFDLMNDLTVSDIDRQNILNNTTVTI
jgi:hypothetical protein